MNFGMNRTRWQSVCSTALSSRQMYKLQREWISMGEFSEHPRQDHQAMSDRRGEAKLSIEQLQVTIALAQYRLTIMVYALR